MRVQRVYKKSKKTTVQLTSLLDLLFVMIFVSLIQDKPIKVENRTPPVKKEKVVKTEPIEKPKPVEEVKPEPVKVPETFVIQAEFHFYASSSTTIQFPPGKYMMQGTFDERTRTLKLGGLSWIQKPAGIDPNMDIDMVPLTGIINDQLNKFTGRVVSPGCNEFSLEKVKSASRTPISGVWKGVYTCVQGSTGLTLTID